METGVVARGKKNWQNRRRLGKGNTQRCKRKKGPLFGRIKTTAVVWKKTGKKKKTRG